MSSPGWFLGAYGADCQTTCDQVGLECSESHLLAHNVDLGHAFASQALFTDNATNTDTEKQPTLAASLYARTRLYRT